MYVPVSGSGFEWGPEWYGVGGTDGDGRWNVEVGCGLGLEG